MSGWVGGRFIVAEGRGYVWKLNVEEENEVHGRSSTQMGVWVRATDTRVIILAARVPDPIINKRTLNLKLICLLIED